MKRPMLVIGFSCLAASVLLSRISAAAGTVLALLFIILFAVTVFIRKTRQALTLPTAFLSAALACLLFFGYTALSFTPAAQCCNEKTRVEAHILSLPDGRESNGSLRYIIKTDSIGNKKISRKMRLTVYKELKADIYDNISFDGRVFLLGGGESEYELYYKAVRMDLGAYTSSVVTVTAPQKKTPYYYILNEKQKISEKICAAMPGDNGGLLVALLFGDKGSISEDFKSNMQTAGLSHLMAVSGLHLSAWAMLVVEFLKRLKLPRKITAIAGALPVLAVMAFSAFSTSVMRAGAMMLLYLVGSFLGERTEGLNSLGFACFILILFNPYIVCDVSFLLSVSAAAGVLICADTVLNGMEATMKIKLRRLYYIPYTVISAALISVFAQIFTLPVSVYYFGTVSPYSVFANVLVSLPAVFCMYLTPVLFLLSGVPFFGSVISEVLGLVTSYIIRTAEFVSSLPCATVRADYPYVYACILTVIAVFCVMYPITKKRVKSAVISLTAGLAVILAGAAMYYIYDASHVKVCALPTGNGLCVIVERQGKADVIGCMGDYYTSNEISEEADRKNLIIENVIIPSYKSYDRDELKDTAQYNPDAEFIASGEVQTGPEYVKTGNTVISPCDGVTLTVENGYVLCEIYGTTIIAGTDFPPESADILITDRLPGDSSGFGSVIVQNEGSSESENLYFTQGSLKTEITVSRSGCRIKGG
ncbi:MAG: ComEC/Rec2 family competence protein [Clostridia bacterium]|nr:ComEC/Rec2 family competence protein [Clostridia bacterium]